MSESSGKRGLRAFVDWVENGADRDEEAVASGMAGHDKEAGAYSPSGRKMAWGQTAEKAAVRTAKRTMGRRLAEFTENMPCVCSAASTGPWHR